MSEEVALEEAMDLSKDMMMMMMMTMTFMYNSDVACHFFFTQIYSYKVLG